MSLFVPRVWVSSEISSSISERVRTMLLKEAEHGRASGATIEPDNNWVSRLILLAESGNVMQILLSSWNGGIA